MKREQITEAYEITRTAPVNLSAKDRWLFKPDLKRKFITRYLLKINNAFVTRDVVFANRQFYEGYSLKHSLTIWRKAYRIILLSRKKQFLNKGIWITDNWSQNYFHWLTDTLVRYEASRHLIEGHKVILPNEFKNISFIQSCLNILDITPHYFERNRPLKIKELLLPDYVSPSASYRKNIIGRLRERLMKKVDYVNSYRRLFVSRKITSRRNIKNEYEVIKLLKNYDFEVVCFEEMTFREQIKVSAESQYMVGLHGAGLTNMMFMNPDSSVLELRAENDDFNNCYFSLSSAMDLNYYYALCNTETNDIRETDVVVDIEILEEVLNKMLT